MRLDVPRTAGLAIRPGVGRPRLKKASQSFILTFIAVALLAGFLSPLLRSASLSIKDTQQINTLGSPIYPSDPEKYTYKGRALDVYQVPIDGTVRNLALVQGGRTSSQFIDPTNPDAGIITWQGSYRALSPAWVAAPHTENYPECVEPDQLPAAAVQHRGDRHHRHDRHAPVMHGRGLRVRALPIPGSQPPVHPADLHDLPARDGHDRAHLHHVAVAGSI